MRCPKCGGLMSFEEFMNVSEGMPWSYKGWRCVYCGEIIDPLILLNRMKARWQREQEEDAAMTEDGAKERSLCRS